MIRLADALIATLILGLSLSSVSAQSNNKSSGSDSGGGTITGRVLVQGKPLEGATITLWQGASEPIPSATTATARTGIDGKYELTHVSSGNYFISATAPGFVTGRENNTLSNLRLVTVVGANAIDPIDFNLVPEGVIKGMVMEADGKAVARVPVTLFPEAMPDRQMTPLYARGLRTDDQGTYRVAGVPAGRYRIAAGYDWVASATLRGLPGYRQAFYPNASDQANARVIEIKAGLEVADVNINLGRPVKVFSVMAAVIDSKDGKPVQDIDARLEGFSNGKRIGGTLVHSHSNARGEVRIENVPPGEYSIKVPSNSGLRPAGEIPPAPNIFGESKHFQVTDSDVDAIEVRVVRAATVSGLVVIEGAAGADILARVPRMHLVALVEPRPGGANPTMETNIRPDRSFVFTGLMPGNLRFFFHSPPDGPLPLRLVRVERDGVRLDQNPEIEAGSQIAGLHVVLGYANSSIHGMIKLDNNAFPQNAGAWVTVLQYGKVIAGVSTDPQGEFVVQHLSAGEYTLAVIARGRTIPELKAEQNIVIPDDKVSEVIIRLNSAPKP